MPRAAVIVAHPDDESLWCGGWILEHSHWDWFVLTLCRRSDADRARRFADALTYLRSEGTMCDLDDGPAQRPLDAALVRQTILQALPRLDYDVVLTHGPRGEYTRHQRHDECSRAVVGLWAEGKLQTRQMRLFAYGDQGGRTIPTASADADEQVTLSADVFARKYHIITALYGFANHSWEARTTPDTEAFYVADTPLGLPGTTQHQAASELQ